MKTDLLPCPFCGGEAKIVRKTGDWGYTPDSSLVKCTKCWVSIPPKDTEKWESGKGTFSIRDAVEKELSVVWNMRQEKP